ncbi:MAG: D-alanyl-D-alanine carboxypeptidase [Paenibacillaceae bacterium]|nr:D-alanyl-D-alanine carboxypeptidase [Paenibacillaceae bacterium]
MTNRFKLTLLAVLSGLLVWSAAADGRFAALTTRLHGWASDVAVPGGKEQGGGGPSAVAEAADAGKNAGKATDGTPAIGSLDAKAAIVIDAASGDVLYRAADTKRVYPASTTKVLSALVAIERGNLNDIVTVGDEVKPEEADESSAGLVPGERLKLVDLIGAMLLPSGNDAARAVAVYIGRQSEKSPTLSAAKATRAFVTLMNARAKQAGATGSNFVNPHGLHNANHYTTARDMALIAQAAMKLPAFQTIVAKRSYDAKLQGKGGSLPLVNRNLLLQPDSGYYVQGVSGVKTGFTDQAGYCLVSSATRGGSSIIAVAMHSTSVGVWTDSAQLLAYGFNTIKSKER